MIKLKIEKWNFCKEAAFSSSWDDMTISSIYDITNEANKRNIKTTIYINGINKQWKTKLFYGNNRKNSTDLIFNKTIKNRLKEIYKNGNEIGNHTYSHKNLKKCKHEDAILDIEKCTKLIQNITSQKEQTFCYPYGYVSSDKTLLKYLKNNFVSVRCANYPKNKVDSLNYINTNINLGELKTIHIGPYSYEKKIDELNYYIDKTIERSGWLIEYGHGFENDAWKPIKKQKIIEHYEYIKNKNIWCDTILNISKYIIQRNNLKIIISSDDDVYILKFENYKFDDIPITISHDPNINLLVVQSEKNIPTYHNNNKKYFIIYNYNIPCVIKILR